MVGGVDALDVHEHFNDGAHVDGVEEAILHGQGDQAARDGSMNNPAHSYQSSSPSHILSRPSSLEVVTDNRPHRPRRQA